MYFILIQDTSSSLILWSKTKVFDVKNYYNFDRVSMEDMSDNLNELSINERLNVLPIFLFDSNVVESEYKSFIKEQIFHNPSVLSSSVTPYLYKNDNKDLSLMEYFEGSNVKIEEIEITIALDYLKNMNFDQFTNPFILLISIPSSLPNKEVSQFIQSINNFIKNDDNISMTGALFTPPSYSPSKAIKDSEVRRQLIYYESTYVYMTPELLAGLLTGIFFLVVVYLGLSCMDGIQTPSHMPMSVPKGREF